MDDYNVKFGSSSNTFKSRKKLLNTVRFKCFLSFKARGEKKETGEERGGDRKREGEMRQEERGGEETGGDKESMRE